MAIAESDIPIISAVGHETDFTISDFVADLRAPTPSAAAELAVPDIREQSLLVNSLYAQCRECVEYKITSEKEQIDFIAKRLQYLNPEAVIEKNIQTVDILSQRIYDKINEIFTVKSGKLASAAARLDALNPMKVLSRGYAVAYKDGSIVASAEKINTGDRLNLKFHDGEVSVTAD